MRAPVALVILLGVAGAAAWPPPSAALAQGTPSSAPVRLVMAFQEAWNVGSAERVLPFFADDAVVVDAPNGGTHNGRDAIHRWLAGQLGRETHIISGWGHTVSADGRGDLVRWNARLSNFTTRMLRAPPVEAVVETVVRDAKIAAYAITTDAASLTRQAAAVRDAYATRTALVDVAGPSSASLPPIPTYPPHEPVQLPNVADRPMPAPLPWLATGGFSLVAVLLAMAKRPPRV